MTSSPSITHRDSAGITRTQGRALLGASVGQFIEFYDFALYGIASVTLVKLFFPSSSEAAGLLALFATYGVSFFIRPVGGLFFGWLGDKYGRITVLVSSILLIGISTGAIGLLPPVASWGAAATVLLVLCRLLQGFSAGGESVGSPAFAFEHAPVHRRGLFITITLAATALPSVVAALIMLSLQANLSEADFEAWGWRIPFLLAVPLAIVGLIIRAKTEESPAYREMAEELEEQAEQASPLKDAFKTNAREMVQVLFIMGMTAMGFYFLSGYFIPYVQTAGGLTGVQALWVNAVAMTSYTILLPLFGVLGDRIGRRPMLFAGLGAIIVLSPVAFWLVSSGNIGLAVAGQLLFVLAITAYGGGCYPFFVEVFTTRTRLTSAAFSYNVAYAVFGGTAPFVGTLLVEKSGHATAPAYYIVAMAIVTLVLIFALRVRETRGLEH